MKNILRVTIVWLVFTATGSSLTQGQSVVNDIPLPDCHPGFPCVLGQ